MVLEKIKDTENNGSEFLNASEEIAENITDIHDTLLKIKDLIFQENCMLN